MKNILSPEVKQEILNRIETLKPDSKARWGKMNVNQALRHMALALEIPIGKLNPTLVQPIKMPKWLLRFFLLNVKPPKEAAETFVEINMVKGNIYPTEFETEKNNLKNKINEFCAALHFIDENKLVGKFSRND